MKTSLTLLAGLIIGLIAGIYIYPLLSEEKDVEQHSENNEADKQETIQQTTDPCEDPEGLVPLSEKAQGITLANAFAMFDDYHGITHSNGKACMTTTVWEDEVAVQKNIESIFLPYDGFLEVIKCRVENENESFLGLAGIPAYNSHPATLSHTMIWVPVVEGENSRPQYFIPQQNTTKFIFEYVGICPEDCPENRCDLWKRDWDPNATCPVNF